MPRLKEPIPLPLSILDPTQGKGELGRVLRRTHIFPPLYRPLFALDVAILNHQAKHQSQEFFLKGEGPLRVNNFNQAIYFSLERIFHLAHERERPKTFYERHMNRANDIVMELVERIAPEQANNLSLLNEVALIRNPGEVLQLLQSPYTTERLRFELTRQVALALISAQVEIGKRDLRKKIKELNSWLDIDLFDHGIKTGEGESRLVTSIHDPSTNDVLYLYGAKNNPNRPNTPGIKREQYMRMRYVEDVGYVVTNPRLKKSRNAVKKVLLLAADKTTEGSDITPVLTDKGGMMFVVANEFYNEGNGVTLLMDKVKASIKKRFHVTDSAFVEDNNTDGHDYQKRKNSFRRLRVQLPGIDDQIELIFTAMGEQLNRDNSIGEYDPELGMYDGLAHSLYEARRDNKAFQMLFPQDNPSLYGHIPFDSISQRFFQRVTKSIVEDHLVKDTSTPQSYRRELSQLYNTQNVLLDTARQVVDRRDNRNNQK